MQIEPIGKYNGDAPWKFDAPRQGVCAGGHGVVELLPHKNFETALRDIEGFERIWLLFIFDRNGDAWRPTTRPPIQVPGHERVGLFASRSPYRPNPIGLSCVRLVSVKGLALEVAECDLLDGTPIIDIKPYLPYADSFPNARAGWVDEQINNAWIIVREPLFQEQAEAIKQWCGHDFAATAVNQLSAEPLDSSRKRIAMTDESSNGIIKAVLSLRMFRIDYSVNQSAHEVTLHRIRSGYSAEELADESDKYNDKAVHRKFVSTFNLLPKHQDP